MDKLRKLEFIVDDSVNAPYGMEFITDRGVDWTIEQYSRNRQPLRMELVKNEETEETTPTAREVDLGRYNIT
jgi:hypothetical protein